MPVAEDAKKAKKLEADLEQALSELPEYLTPYVPGSGTVLSLHGTGALGVASAFHHPFVRRLRRLARAAAEPVLTKLCERACPRDGRPWGLAMLAEPLMARGHGQRPGDKPHYWHRDFALDAGHADLLLGGWLAIGGEQRFRAVLGSHRDAEGRLARPEKGAKRGFVPLASEVLDRMIAEATTIEVPQGSLLIFFESMAHVVLDDPGPMTRLFTGWRLAPRGSEPLRAQRELQARLCEQEPCPRKSGEPVGHAVPASYRGKAEAIHKWREANLQPPLADRQRPGHNVPIGLRELERLTGGVVRPFERNDQVDTDVLAPRTVFPPGADVATRGRSVDGERRKEKRRRTAP